MIERTAVLIGAEWKPVLELTPTEFQRLYDEMGERLEAMMDEEGVVDALLSSGEQEGDNG